jgi:metallophosphoesterase superfamily enzyme
MVKHSKTRGGTQRVHCTKCGHRPVVYKCYNSNRMLVIGDLHAPFIKPGYLEFCRSIYGKYNCNRVMFIGDLIDNHFSSFHDTDPDGHGAAEELRRAKETIADWYKTFPEAYVVIGNHDLIPSRRLFNAGVTTSWIRPISEVLDVPNWEFAEEFTIDDIKYCHGTNRKAQNRAKDDLISIVQGHYHSEGYITHYVGDSYAIFAMQVGCGVDRTAYSMAYGKAFKKMHTSCGVVLENGRLPILEYMEL